MKLGILHLSDIHIRNSTDSVLDSAACIARASYNFAHESESFIIVVTGDIAFSGQEHEYALAKMLFSEVRSLIECEIGRQVHMVVAPGNHDCVLKPEDEIRTLVIQQIVQDNNKANIAAYIKQCTAVQANFFKFRDEISTLTVVASDSLWSEYELAVEGEVVRVSVLNAAWMSRLPEPQGQLVFPIEEYEPLLHGKCDLRLSLIHHPLNWYCQSSYHPLKKALRTHSDAVLSGHEHSAGSEEVIDPAMGSVLLFEAPALQPHKNDPSSQFCCLLFDTTNNSVREKRYGVTLGHPSELEEVVHSLKSAARISRGSNKINKDFLSVLSDPGGDFKHPDKSSITSEDVFLYPELEDDDPDLDKKFIFANDIVSGWKSKTHTLLLGDDESGKTFLLKRYYLDAYAQGSLPLFIKASELNSVSGRELEKKIAQLAAVQYSDPNDFIYAEKVNKVALLDDIDRLSGGAKNESRLIEYLGEHFGSVVVTASSRYKINEYVDSSVSDAFADYSTYKIRPFGHIMRHKLIKKWCSLSDLNTRSELDKKVHDIERLLMVILGKNLIPSKPIYLLILLQSCDMQQQGELQNSAFSKYYEYLIVKSLKDAGFRLDQLDEMFNYLSNLAWFYKVEDCKELDSHKIRRFNSEFSAEFASVDFDSRVAILQSAKILSCSGGFYSFSYSYIYYLFVGKYLSDNLHKDNIRELVAGYCKELYRKENANSVMFLTHHGNDPWVIEQISTVLNGCFYEYSPLELNGDTSAVSSLVDSTAQILIDEINDKDVESNQLRSRKYADDCDSDEIPEPNASSSLTPEEREKVIRFTSDVNSMIKTSEILGNITKNYYGSLGRVRKGDYLEQIFNGSLRTLKAVFAEIVDQPDAFVSEMARVIAEKKPGISDVESKRYARNMVFQFVGVICTGFISRVGQVVSSDKIREDISALVETKRTNAFRLIGIAAELVHPGHIPFEDIEKLARDIKSNNFAFTILQSLVFYHLHMFHTTDKDKQRLAASVNISMSQSRAIDAVTNKAKMIK